MCAANCTEAGDVKEAVASLRPTAGRAPTASAGERCRGGFLDNYIKGVIYPARSRPLARAPSRQTLLSVTAARSESYAAKRRLG
jgi:hypothetical protein